jgi:hypothetical protein
MARRPEIPCSRCGKLLYRGTGSLEFPTGRECRQKRRVKYCPKCSKPFEAKGGAIFCSRYCSTSYGKHARRRLRAA